MAIAALGAAAATTGAMSGLTVAHTLAAGDDRIVLVFVSAENDTNAVTSISYGGVAMTFLREEIASPGGFEQHAFMYAIREADLPADGSNNVVVTGAGAVAGITARAFSGVDQSDDPVSFGATGTNVTDHDTPITVGNTTDVVFWGVGNGGTGSYSSHQCDVGNTAAEQSDQEPASAVHTTAQSSFGVGATGSLVARSTASASVNRFAAVAVVMVEAAAGPTPVTYTKAFNGDDTPDLTISGDYASDAGHGELDRWIRPGPDATGPRILTVSPTPVPARQSFITWAVPPVITAIDADLTVTAPLVGVGVSSSGEVSALVTAAAPLVGAGISSSGQVSVALQAEAPLVGVGVGSSGEASALVALDGDLVGAGVSSSGQASALVTTTAPLVGVGVSSSGLVVSLSDFFLTANLVGVGISSSGQASALVTAQAPLAGVGVSSSGQASSLLQAAAALVGVGVSSSGQVTSEVPPQITANLVGVGISSSGQVSSLVTATTGFVGVGVSSSGQASLFFAARPTETLAHSSPHPATDSSVLPNPATRSSTQPNPITTSET